MKKSILILLVGALLISTPNVWADRPESSVKIRLSDVVNKVSTENYNVYANALKVYQAKESIQVARANLLPKLNLWRVAKVAVDWTSAVELLVEDIAPFLVPANWFRVEEEKILYLAEREGYRALWANEVMTAKSLYIHLLLDQSLLEQIQKSADELRELHLIVSSRELLGGVPQGTSRDIQVRLLALQEDQRAIEVLIGEEKSMLAFMMGFSANTAIQAEAIPMPVFEEMKPLDYADFEFRATDSAPEARQFGHFLKAIDYLKNEVLFSFLGSSSLSRGVGGGVFDGIPIQDGLGFGTPASMRIASAQKEILATQQKGIFETVKRNLSVLVNNYNLDLESYSNLKQREELTKETVDQLFERMELGQTVDAFELIEASRNHIQADTAFFAVKYRFLSNEDKLARLIFHGDYTKEPVEIEKIKERN